MKTENDFKTIEAMTVYGGSFVKRLAAAALVADSDNFARIKSAFPKLWNEYENMVRELKKS